VHAVARWLVSCKSQQHTNAASKQTSPTQPACAQPLLPTARPPPPKHLHSAGEPAPEKITDKIYGETVKVDVLKMGDIPDVDLSKV
jgi:hypothetical protein